MARGKHLFPFRTEQLSPSAPVGSGCRRSRKVPVALAWGKHLFPFRTEQLSPTAPMVLGLHGPGRVGRRRFISTSRLRAARVVSWVATPGCCPASAASSRTSSAAGWRQDLRAGAGRTAAVGSGSRLPARRTGSASSLSCHRGHLDDARPGRARFAPKMEALSSAPELRAVRSAVHMPWVSSGPTRELTGSGIRAGSVRIPSPARMFVRARPRARTPTLSPPRSRHRHPRAHARGGGSGPRSTAPGGSAPSARVPAAGTGTGGAPQSGSRAARETGGPRAWTL